MRNFEKVSNTALVCVTLAVLVMVQSSLDLHSALAALVMIAVAATALAFVGYLRHALLFQHRLRKALRNQEIEVHYQPFLRLKDEQIIGAEALLRWPGVSMNIEALVAKAEQRGMIKELTDYVIARAAEDWRAFNAVYPLFRININVSAPELASDSFFERVRQLTQAIPAQALAFELTERQSAPLDSIAANISLLRSEGYKVYIDDFGTGFSSMTTLLGLSIDGFKLDAAFLKSTHGLSAIKALKNLAGNMKAELVVEGVETTVHKYDLMEISEELFAQGWLYGRAMRKSELLKKIANSMTFRNPTVSAALFGDCEHRKSLCKH